MKLTEQTLIPLSLVGSIIGGVIWLSVIYYKSEASAAKLEKLELKLEYLQEKLVMQNEKILERMAVLETKMDRK